MNDMKEGQDVGLRALDPITDLPRLATWLRAPHVRRWWSEADRHLKAAREGPTDGGHTIITVDGEPVGYVRWQRVPRQVLDRLGLADIPDGAVDLDIVIGEPQHVGRGVGPRALRLVLARLLADPTVPLVGMVTSVHNAGAIRAFEKAGLRRFREYDDPVSGRCLVLTGEKITLFLAEEERRGQDNRCPSD